MTDIGLFWDDGAADLAIVENAYTTTDVESDEGLETAVLLSLFTDRWAETTDVLPSSETDRRGWWADAIPVVEGDLWGSRLWLLAREKEQASVLERAREYTREALQWMLDDKVAERVDVTAEIVSRGVLGLTIVIHRPKVDSSDFRFDYNWESQEARRS